MAGVFKYRLHETSKSDPLLKDILFMKKRPSCWWIKHSVRVKCFSERREKKIYNFSWKLGSFPVHIQSFTEHLFYAEHSSRCFMSSHLDMIIHFIQLRRMRWRGVGLPKRTWKWPERHRCMPGGIAKPPLRVGHIWHLVIFILRLYAGHLKCPIFGSF